MNSPARRSKMLYVHYITLCSVVQGKFTIFGVFKVSCCIDFWFRASDSIIVKVCVLCAHGEVQVWLDLSALVLDWSEWLASRSGRFIFGARSSGIC